jgi:hypothetical protein
MKTSLKMLTACFMLLFAIMITAQTNKLQNRRAGIYFELE